MPSLLVLFFLTALLGIAPAIVGSAIFIPKLILRIGCDIAIGVMSDRREIGEAGLNHRFVKPFDWDQRVDIEVEDCTVAPWLSSIAHHSVILAGERKQPDVAAALQRIADHRLQARRHAVDAEQPTGAGRNGTPPEQ